MSVAHLSPGDKLSLKGKIFELQKKLNLLEVVQQNNEQYSFQPEITSYSLPNRQNDFIRNLIGAEQARKENFESIKSSVEHEYAEVCTFAPAINTKKKKTSSDLPVYERLYMKAQEYEINKQKRKEQLTNYDDDGNPLFKPTVESSPFHNNLANIKVDEYLYRDARDRNERMKLRLEEDERNKEAESSKDKMNKKSKILIKRKYERQLRVLFDELLEATIDKKDFVAKPNESIFGGVKENGISSGSDQGGGAHGKVTLQNIETLFTKMVPYFVLDRKSKSSSSYAHSDSIANATKHNKSVSKDVVKEESVIWSTQADKLAFANFIWQTLNPQESDFLSLDQFLKVFIPILLHRDIDVGTQNSFANVMIAINCSSISDLSPVVGRGGMKHFFMVFEEYLQLKASLPPPSPPVATITAQTSSRSQSQSQSQGVYKKSTVSRFAHAAPSSAHVTSEPILETTKDKDDLESPFMLTQGSKGLLPTPLLTTPKALPVSTDKIASNQQVRKYNDLLSNREVQNQQRLANLKASLIEKEMQECTFHPKIAPSSTKLAARHVSNTFTSTLAPDVFFDDEHVDDSYIPRSPTKESDKGGDKGGRALDQDKESLQTNSAKNVSIAESALNMPVHQRLYMQKDKVPRSIEEGKHKTREEEELEGATFAPSLSAKKAKHQSDHYNRKVMRGVGLGNFDSAEDHVRHYRSTSSGDESDFGDNNMPFNVRAFRKYKDDQLSSQEVSDNEEGDGTMSYDMNSTTRSVSNKVEPKGYEETIKRLREANEKRKEKEKFAVEFFQTNDEKYRKSRQRAELGPQPFKFRTEARKMEKDRAISSILGSEDMIAQSPTLASGLKRSGGSAIQPVRLYVDVKLGGGIKDSHIAVADNDVPELLAKNFCKIFSLDESIEQLLTEIVLNNMLANNIPIGTKSTYLSIVNDNHSSQHTTNARHPIETTVTPLPESSKQVQSQFSFGAVVPALQSEDN